MKKNFLDDKKERMAKKCIYCGEHVPEESVIDFCERCGKSVWGEKMFNTIVSNMEKAREKGDLCYPKTIAKKQDE
jgi:uncharacterized UBP type Zn finger protein